MNETRAPSWSEGNWPIRVLCLAGAGSLFLAAAMALTTVAMALTTVAMIIVVAVAWLIDIPLSLPIGAVFRWTVYSLVAGGAASIARQLALQLIKFLDDRRSGVKS